MSVIYPLKWRWVGSAVAATVLLTSVLPAAIAQEASELTQNPLAGSQVFGTKGCVKCHAINGLGGAVGPDLGRIAQRRSFFELAATMWNHLPTMGAAMTEYGIARPQMDAREAGDLIAFLFTLDYFDPPGDVERGKDLFVEKKCVVCHQVGVYGGVIGPALDYLSQYGSPILVAAAMWNHGPAMAREMELKGIDRPDFAESELTDLIAYLESVGPQPLQGPLYVLPGRAAEGRVIFYEKRCVECHSVYGVGGRVGSDLARRGQHRSLTEFAAGMWNKAPAMMGAMRRRGVSLPQLGAGEMADLVAYLYSVEYFAEAGDVQRGERHLRAKGCLRCHALSGEVESTAGDFGSLRGMESPAGIISAAWNHAPLMEAALAAVGAEWPTFSPLEIADVTAFLQMTAER